jgi:hypothetical protein
MMDYIAATLKEEISRFDLVALFVFNTAREYSQLGAWVVASWRKSCYFSLFEDSNS